MARRLTLSIVRSPLTAPLLDGVLAVPGVTFDMNEAKSVNRNSTEMVNGKYDIAEMSLATYFKAREDGLPFVGIPVFTGRRFVHSGIHTRRGSGIRHPADLAGKRVGVPQYWMTSSVWHRVLLSQEYGLDANAMRWVTTGSERLKSAGFPPDLEVATVEGKLPGELLADGTVDAVLVPKRGGRLMAGAAFEAPFADVVSAQRASYARNGVFPIMHFIVVRGAVTDDMPELPKRLLDAFAAAKAGALQTAGGFEGMEEPVYGETVDDVMPLFGGDPWPYGLAANRRTLEVFQDCLIEQGLIRTPRPLESLFAGDTETVG